MGREPVGRDQGVAAGRRPVIARAMRVLGLAVIVTASLLAAVGLLLVGDVKPVRSLQLADRDRAALGRLQRHRTDGEGRYL